MENFYSNQHLPEEEQTSFLNDPFIIKDNLNAFFEEYRKIAEEALRIIDPTGIYSPQDFEQELRGLYMLVGEGDLLETAKSVASYVTESEEDLELNKFKQGRSDKLLANLTRKINPDIELSELGSIIIDDVMYSGRQKLQLVKDLQMRGVKNIHVFVSGTSLNALSELTRNGIIVHYQKLIPTILGNFTDSAKKIWIYSRLGRESYARINWKDYTPDSVIKAYNLDAQATTTIYKLPDDVSLIPSLREINGVRIYDNKPISQYPK